MATRVHQKKADLTMAKKLDRVIGQLRDALSEAADAQRADLKKALLHLGPTLQTKEPWLDYSLLTRGGWLLGNPANWGAPPVQTPVPTTLWLTKPLADSVKPVVSEPVIEDIDIELDDGLLAELLVEVAASGGRFMPTPPSPPAVPMAGTK